MFRRNLQSSKLFKTFNLLEMLQHCAKFDGIVLEIWIANSSDYKRATKFAISRWANGSLLFLINVKNFCKVKYSICDLHYKSSAKSGRIPKLIFHKCVQNRLHTPSNYTKLKIIFINSHYTFFFIKNPFLTLAPEIL